MVKKWKYIIILLLLCGVLIALGIKADSFKFPKAVKAEIEEAWLFAYEREMDLDYCEYYGTYNGAVVFFVKGNTDEIWHISVAGAEFKWRVLRDEKVCLFSLIGSVVYLVHRMCKQGIRRVIR